MSHYKPPRGSPPPFVSVAEMFYLMMDAAKDYSIFFTDPQERIVFWNAGAERIMGWTEDEIVGRDARVIYTPEDHAKGDPERELAIAAAEGTATNERWHVRKDGSRFWGSGIVNALRDEAGELRGFCKIMRDLTERRRLEEELKAALDKQNRVMETLQNSLLMVPPPDAFPGLAIKPLYESASDDTLVGGDFFDTFALAEDTIALVVGDATGHGIEAVMYTSEVKFALRVLLREYPNPAVAMERLNAFLVDKTRLDPSRTGNSYIALAVCVVDTRAQELSCAWAGIEPPFVLRADTDEVTELMECGGPLLGVDVGVEYRAQRVSLGVGDVLAMSSDGLTEARRRNNQGRIEFFGYDGLTAAVREEVARHPSSLGDAGVA
ncbi:MAG: SpoIIE family protein phosphatase, partial [Fibrella sp.]|nr:SpoIIE family protein phosphatase [Armatimonadota bacterium]